MTILVNTYTEQEEKQLLAFLDSMKYDYTQQENVFLSQEQQKEILQRDKEYEAGEAKSYSLDEVIAYFNITGK